MDPGTKREMMEKVGQYKKTLASVQRDHADTQKQAEEEQNTLLCGSGQNNYGEATADQRGRLVAANENLGQWGSTIHRRHRHRHHHHHHHALKERGTSRIRHAMEIVAETEDTALEITEELARNREKIESTSNRVRQVGRWAWGGCGVAEAWPRRGRGRGRGRAAAQASSESGASGRDPEPHPPPRPPPP